MLISGGWLNVATLKQADSSPAWTAETSYRGISNYQNNLMGISTSAMRQLRSHLNFTQLRFHCSKENGHTFHVITVNNSTGEAVVQYFSGQSSVLPASCGSFITMKDDNSYLAQQCHRWGNDGSHYVGKWGHYNKNEERRMYDHSAFVAHRYHWVVYNNLWLCDESKGNVFATSTEDFWKIYVRWKWRIKNADCLTVFRLSALMCRKSIVWYLQNRWICSLHDKKITQFFSFKAPFL